ncbi:galectin-4-like isoform 2-T2 [Vipera latastei]
MYLLLMFAVTFMLSAQEENGSEMMAKIMNEIGEEGREQIINALEEYELEKLMDCIESMCKTKDFMDLVQKMVSIFKRISYGDQLIYKMIKAFVRQGLLDELGNALKTEEIVKLMDMDKDQNNIPDLMLIRKKITPISKKAEVGEDLSKLTNGNDEKGKKTLPYHHSVPGGLHTGMSIYVQGTVPKCVKRFCVYFACCRHEGADVTFHFSPQFDIDKTVLNTFWDGKWGKEEHHKMPFRKGEKFEIIFIVNNTGYQILVNRKLYCTFGHRMPPQNMREIRVDGDLELQSLHVIGEAKMENLILPYHQPVPGGLHPGMSVHVEGTVPKHSKSFPVWFRVNLACTYTELNNIPLHFIPTFVYNHIGLNTLHGSRWGWEEKHKMVLREREHFEVIFIVDKDQYQVLVNRKPFCTYRHRIPPQRVQDINVDGNLQLHSLIVMGGPTKGNMIMMGPAIYYPPVPYICDIPGGLKANRTITVRGTIPKNAKRFEIKLMAGQDIALSISPHLEKKTMVCNSFLNGNWEPEEHNLLFNLFQPGKYFELSIHCDNHKFKIYANSQPFFSYAYRYVPIENIKTIKITGNVTLSYITY